MRHKPTDVSKKRTASNFRVEEEAKQETSNKQAAKCKRLPSGLLDLFMDPLDGGSMSFRNICELLPD
jgi:hypothetical protein